MRITIRIPEDLEASLREEAKKKERSINGQIVYILRKHYHTQWPRFSGARVGEPPLPTRIEKGEKVCQRRDYRRE